MAGKKSNIRSLTTPSYVATNQERYSEMRLTNKKLQYE